MSPIKILSLPSYHPYILKFNHHAAIEFINPDCDFFGSDTLHSPEYLDKHFPPNLYDIVHIHFEYYLWSLSQLKNLIIYFKKHHKPIVWTWHDRGNLLKREYDQGYELLLFNSADKIITLSNGMKSWIIKSYGFHKNQIDVIPSGYISSPDSVRSIANKIKKQRTLFTMLIGDFRESKEYLQSIISFLDCSELESATLQLIFRPFSIYSSNSIKINERLIAFHNLLNHPRIKIFSKPEFSDLEMTKAFYKSHAVILPYLWGTHSGQIELAKDCGCHVVVSDVGFYDEQWDKLALYSIKDVARIPTNYTKALVKVYTTISIQPIGTTRKKEFKKILDSHVKIYRSLLGRNV